jgi:pimeloyl-ACP methyl ester carboxylesterase
MGLQVGSIEQPVLLVWGKQDEILDPKFVHEFERDIPHVETLMIDACGHLPHLEQSEAVATAIQNFMPCKQASAPASSAAFSAP